MGRTRVNDSPLAAAVIHEIRGLFGTIPNAFRHLAPFEAPVDESMFRRAMLIQAVTPEVRHVIEDFWRAWQAQFLKRQYVGKGDTLLLDPVNPYRMEEMKAKLEKEKYG